MLDTSDSLMNDEDDPDFEAMIAASSRLGLCPSPGLLFAAHEDVLPTEAGASIRAHSANCILCQTLLEGLAPAQTELTPGQQSRIYARIEKGRGANGFKFTDPRRLHNKRLWLSSAAIVLLTVGCIAMYHQLHPPARTSQKGEANTSTQASHKPAVEVISQDFAELHTLAPLPAPAGSPEPVTRGDSKSSDAPVSLLLPPFRAYNRGDFAAAAAAFAPVAAQYPTSDIPALYLGVAQLQLGQNAAARETLTHAVTVAKHGRADAAEWYLAIAEARTEKTSDALRRLQILCATQSPYAQRSCELAKLLQVR